MNSQLACPEPARLKLLLDGSLPESDQAELTGHLETCENCQQTLESLVAGSETWAEVALQLGRQTPEQSEGGLRARDGRLCVGVAQPSGSCLAASGFSFCRSECH